MPTPAQQAQILQIERSLDADATPETFGAYERFGEMMMAEVQARTVTVETKAQNVIGWAAALIALLLSNGGTLVGALELILIGAVAAGAAIVAGAVALLARKVSWASAEDWFCLDLLGNAHRLRAYHLISQLENYFEQNNRSERKAQFLVIAQWALIVAALCFAVALIVTTWRQVFSPVAVPDVPAAPVL